MTREHKIIPQTVSDIDAVDASINFMNDHCVVTEPACGAALSLIYKKNPCLANFKNILMIVCGGAGVTANQLLGYKKELG